MTTNRNLSLLAPNVDAFGILKVGGYILPTASTTTLGAVKVDGSTITINNGVISGSSTYSLPTASTSILGGVKVDGSTITINGSGVISSSGGGGGSTPYNIDGGFYNSIYTGTTAIDAGGIT